MSVLKNRHDLGNGKEIIYPFYLLFFLHTSLKILSDSYRNSDPESFRECLRFLPCMKKKIASQNLGRLFISHSLNKQFKNYTAFHFLSTKLLFLHNQASHQRQFSKILVNDSFLLNVLIHAQSHNQSHLQERKVGE